MIKQKTALMVLSIMLCAALLTSCASAGKLSDSEVTQLREQYPVLVNEADPFLTKIYPDTDTFSNVKESYRRGSIGIIEATVLGNDASTIQIAPAEGMAKETMNLIFLQLHVDSVIAQPSDRNIQGDISVYVGTRENEGDRFDFAPGTKLVISLFDIGKDTDPEHCPDGYSSSLDTSYYLTEDNHLLAIFDYPGPKEMDGKPLSAFRSEVKNIFQ